MNCERFDTVFGFCDVLFLEDSARFAFLSWHQRSSFPSQFLTSPIHPFSASFNATTALGIINCESFTSAVGLNEARFLEGLVFLRALHERVLALSCLDIADATPIYSNKRQQRALIYLLDQRQ
jgi:hypothetical protein